jgi:hypothetical protein
MSAWHPAWPGFEASGSLVLPLPRNEFAALPQALRVGDLELERKREFHVTLLLHTLGASLQRAATADATLAAQLPKLFATLDWRWQRTGERWLLREGGAHTLIELIAMPALQAFRQEIGYRLGEPLPPTPAHVTLYLANTTRGIGLASDADFERLRLHPL